MFGSRIQAKIRNVQLQLELKFRLNSNNYRVEQPSAISSLQFLFSFYAQARGEGSRCLPADASEDALQVNYAVLIRFLFILRLVYLLATITTYDFTTVACRIANLTRETDWHVKLVVK